MKHRNHPRTYKAAGVDIEAAEKVVRRVTRRARSTFTSSVLSEIGSFGAAFDASFRGYRRPVLVSSIDGVGTKVKLAARMGRHGTIGEDLVNHCVNDILVCGAKPLFVLDYIGFGNLSPSIANEILSGMIRACKRNGCSLIGGETAEMPGLYRQGEYDVVGAIVGIAEKDKLLNKKDVKEGDQLLALPSSGLHTNGYSLARKVLLRRYRLTEFVGELGKTLGDALLTIHRSYLRPVAALRQAIEIHAMAHITGGGIIGNTSRVLPSGLALEIDWNSWKRPAIFRLIQSVGNVPEQDMRRTFNLGVGLVFIVNRKDVKKGMEKLRRAGENPFVIGRVVRAN